MKFMSVSVQSSQRRKTRLLRQSWDETCRAWEAEKRVDAITYGEAVKARLSVRISRFTQTVQWSYPNTGYPNANASSAYLLFRTTALKVHTLVCGICCVRAVRRRIHRYPDRVPIELEITMSFHMMTSYQFKKRTSLLRLPWSLNLARSHPAVAAISWAMTMEAESIFLFIMVLMRTRKDHGRYFWSSISQLRMLATGKTGNCLIV